MTIHPELQYSEIPLHDDSTRETEQQIQNFITSPIHFHIDKSGLPSILETQEPTAPEQEIVQSNTSATPNESDHSHYDPELITLRIVIFLVTVAAALSGIAVLVAVVCNQPDQHVRITTKPTIIEEHHHHHSIITVKTKKYYVKHLTGRKDRFSPSWFKEYIKLYTENTSGCIGHMPQQDNHCSNRQLCPGSYCHTERCLCKFSKYPQWIKLICYSTQNTYNLWCRNNCPSLNKNCAQCYCLPATERHQRGVLPTQNIIPNRKLRIKRSLNSPITTPVIFGRFNNAAIRCKFLVQQHYECISAANLSSIQPCQINLLRRLKAKNLTISILFKLAVITASSQEKYIVKSSAGDNICETNVRPFLTTSAFMSTIPVCTDTFVYNQQYDSVRLFFYKTTYPVIPTTQITTQRMLDTTTTTTTATTLSTPTTTTIFPIITKTTKTSDKNNYLIFGHLLLPYLYCKTTTYLNNTIIKKSKKIPKCTMNRLLNFQKSKPNTPIFGQIYQENQSTSTIVPKYILTSKKGELVCRTKYKTLNITQYSYDLIPPCNETTFIKSTAATNHYRLLYYKAMITTLPTTLSSTIKTTILPIPPITSTTRAHLILMRMDKKEMGQAICELQIPDFRYKPITSVHLCAPNTKFKSVIMKSYQNTSTTLNSMSQGYYMFNKTLYYQLPNGSLCIIKNTPMERIFNISIYGKNCSSFGIYTFNNKVNHTYSWQIITQASSKRTIPIKYLSGQPFPLKRSTIYYIANRSPNQFRPSTFCQYHLNEEWYGYKYHQMNNCPIKYGTPLTPTGHTLIICTSEGIASQQNFAAKQCDYYLVQQTCDLWQISSYTSNPNNKIKLLNKTSCAINAPNPPPCLTYCTVGNDDPITTTVTPSTSTMIPIITANSTIATVQNSTIPLTLFLNTSTQSSINTTRIPATTISLPQFYYGLYGITSFGRKESLCYYRPQDIAQKPLSQNINNNTCQSQLPYLLDNMTLLHPTLQREDIITKYLLTLTWHQNQFYVSTTTAHQTYCHYQIFPWTNNDFHNTDKCINKPANAFGQNAALFWKPPRYTTLALSIYTPSFPTKITTTIPTTRPPTSNYLLNNRGRRSTVCSLKEIKDCKELERLGACTGSTLTSVNNLPPTVSTMQDLCPVACYACLQFPSYESLTSTNITKEDCLTGTTLTNCTDTMLCPVSLGTCPTNQLLGKLYNCAKRQELRLHDIHQPEVAIAGTIPQTYYANIFKVDPQQSVLLGYALSIWHYTQKINTIWTIPVNKPHTLNTTLNSWYWDMTQNISNKATQSMTTHNGEWLYTWAPIHVSWTGNNPYLKSSQLPNPCASFLANTSRDQDITHFSSYYTNSIPINATNRIKQQHFATADYTLCSRGLEWLIFKRPTNHTINIFQEIANTTLIKNETDLITIGSLGLTTWVRQEIDQIWLTYSNLLISPTNWTSYHLMTHSVAYIDYDKLKFSDQQILSNEASSILALRKQARQSKLREQDLTTIVYKLANHISELPSVLPNEQSKLLGDLMATYTCTPVIQYTPLYSRKIQNQCYHEIPILLDNNTINDIHTCVWHHKLTDFLTQLESYIDQPAKILLSKGGESDGITPTAQLGGLWTPFTDSYDKETTATKGHLQHLWAELISQLHINKTDIYNDQTEGRTLLLDELTRQNITWTCPLHLDSTKIQFLDVRKRQLKKTATPIDCHRQYPIYIKHGVRYYIIKNNGISEIDNVTTQVHGRYYGDKEFKVKELSQLLETHWEETTTPEDIYSTLSANVIQARQNRYDLKRTELLDQSNMKEKRDIKSLNNSITKLSSKEQTDWTTAMRQIHVVNDTLHIFYTTTQTKLEEINQEFLRFEKEIKNINGTITEIKHRIFKVNQTLNGEIDQNKEKVINLHKKVKTNEQHLEILRKKEQELKNQQVTSEQEIKVNRQAARINYYKITTLKIQQKRLQDKIATNLLSIDVIKTKQKIIANKVETNEDNIKKNKKDIKINKIGIVINSENIEKNRKSIRREVEDRKAADQATLEAANKEAEKIAKSIDKKKKASTDGFWGKISKFFSDLWDGISGGIMGLLGPLWDFLKNAIMYVIIIVIACIIIYLVVIFRGPIFSCCKLFYCCSSKNKASLNKKLQQKQLSPMKSLQKSLNQDQQIENNYEYITEQKNGPLEEIIKYAPELTSMAKSEIARKLKEKTNISSVFYIRESAINEGADEYIIKKTT